MIKRLLNPHTLLKITLILTTLLLIPTSSWAERYTISGSDNCQVKSQSGTNVTYSYGWQNSSIKWNAKLTTETGSVAGGQTTLQLTLTNGQSVTLAASRPSDESGYFRKVTLTGLDQSLTATATFGSGNTLTRNGESFEPSTPIQWGSSDEIIITLTNNTANSITCTISSITVLTGTQGYATFSWPDEVSSPIGSNYDVSEIVKSGSGDNVELRGKCEQDATYNFLLYSSSGSHTINYSSNNSSVAEVTDDGVVTVKSAGEATITAVPEGDDYNYYLPSSYRLIITDTYQFCDLIVGGRRVTTGNSNNILKDENHTVSFDGNQTLTLNGVNLQYDGIISSRSTLSIKIVGTNKITISDPNEACIKSTNGGSIAFEKGNGEAENNLLLKHTGEGGRAIKEVNSITLGDGLYSLPTYEDSPSDWIAKEKEIFITDKQIYDLNIAGTQVTEGNRDNVLNDGYKSISYNPTTFTLTLKGTNTDGEVIVGGSINTLNVHIVGYSQIGGLSCNEATTLSFTTSTKLPGKLEIANFSATGTVNYANGLEEYNTQNHLISASLGNIEESTFTDGSIYVNTDNGDNSFIYSHGSSAYSASYATQTGSMIVVSPKNGGTTAALWPSSPSDLGTLKKVYLQFDWGSCTNESVTVQVKGLNNDNGTTVTVGEYSSSISLGTADDDGIVEVPITGTISSENIELYFSSNSTFSFVPLVVAMENYETYGLYVGEVAVTEQNKSNVFGNGTVEYESGTNTLTLKGANITSNSNDFPGILYYGEANLNIKLEGTNTMNNSTFTCNTDFAPYLNFIIDTDNPGTLTMTNGVGESYSPSFSDVKSNFIDGFNIKYENANYDYDYKQNPDQPQTYIGTYKISILKPSIWTSIEDVRKLKAVNPMAETNAGTIKYSVVYADGTEGVEDQDYNDNDPYPLEGPATVTSYIAYGNSKKSGTATGYYFGASPKTQKLVYGTEAPTLNLQLAPQVEGISIYDFLINSYFVRTVDGTVAIKGVGRTQGFAYLNKEQDLTFTNLADSIGFVLEVLPANPTFSVDEGTYNQTQKVTLVSPYNDPNNIANELGTGGSAAISIKYYLGETKPAEPLTYSGPITISESTKLTAWVEVKYEIPYLSPDQQSSGGVTTEIYESEAVTKSYVLDRDITDAIVTLADNKTELTYNEASNVPTITRVYLTEGSETLSTTIELNTNDYTISYVKVNGETEETIEASNIINAGSYKMILTGKGDFSGTKSVPFTIVPRTITNLTFNLSATSFTYNGEEQKPTVTVQFKETELEASMGTTKTIPTTDYDITYSGECINAATYTVSATLKGNYSGEGSTTFDITKATITPHVTIEGWTYGATANTPTISGNTGNGNVSYEYKLKNAADSEYKTEAPTETGEYTIKATIAATTNYEAATDSTHFTIAKANITPTVTLEGWTFGATANTPEVTGNTGNGAETFTYKAEGSEAFTSEVPTAVGTHIVKVTIAETTNYNGGEATATFTIINRTFNPANDITFAEGQTYASFYSSSEDLELPEEGIAVFIITGLNGNTLTTQAVSYIPKGVPVLVMKASGTTQAIDPNEVSSNMLQYATSDVNADGTTYILYNGEYVRATGTIPTGKCYLKLNKPSGARTLAIGNGTTGIDRVDNTIWATDNWFDLNGRRIEKPTKKGLYIMNGKKVVVK